MTDYKLGDPVTATFEAPSLEPVWDADTKRWSDDDPRTDEEKHAFCKRRTGLHAVIINKAQYDHFKLEGVDMRYYVVQQPLPPTINYAGDVTGRFECFHRGHRVKKL